MNVLGLDIGTTTVSAVVINRESCEILTSRTILNGADLPADVEGGSLQAADLIIEKVLAVTDELKAEYGPIGAIGIDGQMHGILYVNEEGRAVSPLYTWQDNRGNLPCGESTYVAQLQQITGENMSTGFGLTTHYWMTMNHQVPAAAAKLCTIFDYAAMRLTGRKAPLMHVSGAASLGLYKIHGEDRGWMTEAIARAGMDAAYLPEVAHGCALVGKTPDGIPVSCAIGDNQASFIGSVQHPENSVLVNIGTGGQVSMQCGMQQAIDDLEMRPIVDDSFIIAGSSLCGGRAYALLEGFIRDIAALAGYDGGKLYDAMGKIAMEAIELKDGWKFDTRFSGTRRQPELRATASNISFDTFDAKHLVGSVINGIVDELYNLYLKMPEKPWNLELVGSGNGVRKNKALQRAFELRFGAEIKIPAHNEEAAFGAALYGMTAAGMFSSLQEAQENIRYA